jgi:hypothetical protein
MLSKTFYQLEILKINNTFTLESDFPIEIQNKFFTLGFINNKLSLKIDLPYYIALLLKVEFKNKDNQRFEEDIDIIVTDNSKIVELQLQIFGNSYLNFTGNVSELYFGSCANFYSKVTINTSDLPIINIDETTIDELIINNISQNSALFFQHSAALKFNINTNQKNLKVYSYNDESSFDKTVVSQTHIEFFKLEKK